MKNELPREPVTMSLLDADFNAVELDVNHCDAKVKWLRPVKLNSAEYERGIEVSLTIVLELKREFEKTRALVGPSG